MHVPVTLVALACLTACLFGVRQLWPRIPLALRRLLLALSVLFILISAAMSALGWNTASPTLNALVRWLAVAGYELILLLLTRLRPRWLTALTAVTLLLPIVFTSILLPLTALFERRPPQITPLAPGLLFTRSRWEAAGMGNQGVDVAVARVPAWAPFLRDQLASLRVYDSQCDTSAVSATLDTAHRLVVVHCPPDPARSGDAPSEFPLHLH